MRFPNPCIRCLDIPVQSRCSLDYCVECPVFVEFFLAGAYDQMSFDDLLSADSMPVKPMSFSEYELASVAKEREELL